MSILFRRTEDRIDHRQVEHRTIASVPWDQGGFIRPQTQGQALTLAPVYSAVRLLCDSLATLPVKSYRKIGEDRLPMSSPPTLISLLLDAGRLPTWLTEAVASLALRGNAVGMKGNLDGFGFPTTIQWLSMDDVYVDDSRYPAVTWYYRGRTVDPSMLLHIPWVTMPGKTLGLSPIEVYALTINAGLKAQAFGAGWFENGGVPPGTFKNEAQTISTEEAETISARLVRAIRKGRPLTYGKDWTYTPLTIPPEQAQFIESQKLTATQVAAIYGIDPTWIGGESGNSLTYANVEQRAIEFTTFGLRPWLVRMESGITSVIPALQYVSFNADALVRADLKTRHLVYQIDRAMGLRNLDEIRALEDLPPLPDGKGQDYTPVADSPNKAIPAADSPLAPDGTPPPANPAKPPAARLSVIHEGVPK